MARRSYGPKTSQRKCLLLTANRGEDFNNLGFRFGGYVRQDVGSGDIVLGSAAVPDTPPSPRRNSSSQSLSPNGFGKAAVLTAEGIALRTES
jgi:hypothetical protein